MRPIHSLLPLCVAGVLLTAACGGSSATGTSSGAPGQSPKQATSASLAQLQTTSVKYDVDGKVSLDTSKVQGVSADTVRQITGALGGAGTITITGTGAQESPKRVSLTLSLKPLVSQQVTAVTYDGANFYSLDGGKKFGSGGSLSSLTGGLGITPDQAAPLFNGLPDTAYSDQGQTQMDGVTVQHYSAQVTKEQVFQAISGGGAAGTQQQQNLALIAQFITAGTSKVDVFVRADNGQLDRYSVDINFGFDIGKLVGAFAGLGTSSSAVGAAGAPSGSLGVGINLAVHFHDYGASITITKPTADPTAPKLPSGLGGLFGG